MNVYQITVKHELTGEEMNLHYAAKTERIAINWWKKESQAGYHKGYYLPKSVEVKCIGETDQFGQLKK